MNENQLNKISKFLNKRHDNAWGDSFTEFNCRLHQSDISCGIYQFSGVRFLITDALNYIRSQRDAHSFARDMAPLVLKEIRKFSNAAAVIFSDTDEGPAYHLGMAMKELSPEDVTVQDLGTNPNSSNHIYMFTVRTEESEREAGAA